MNIKKLKDMLDSFQFQSMEHNSQLRVITQYLYEESDKNLMHLILWVNEIEKQNQKEEMNTMYQGLQDAMHNMSHYSQEIEHLKTTPKKLKNINEFLYNNKDGNIAFIINIAKAYFKNGTSEGASICGIYFFEQFKKFLLKNKDKYLTGKSKDWAINFGHYDYIKLVVDKAKEGKNENKS